VPLRNLFEYAAPRRRAVDFLKIARVLRRINKKILK
jgi:hypothetical protein